MFNRKSAYGKKKEFIAKSLIGPDIHIRGDISFSENLRIDGKVIGNVRAAAGTVCTLSIAETAYIEGEVTAADIILIGTIKGPVTATELLEMQPKAKVDGDVHYASIEMHQGSTITGKLNPMTQDAATAQPLAIGTHAPSEADE